MTHIPFCFQHRRGFARAALLVGIITLGVSVPELAAQRVNFAKFQKITSSSQDISYAPDFAVDGIVSNFHSFRTGGSGPHSLEIAYPRSVTLASAHLYLGLDNVFDANQVLTDFKFQYHDGADWMDVPGSTFTGNAQTEINLIFEESVTAARFRLWTDNSGNRIIREISMFPPNLVEGVEQGFPIGTDVRLSLGYKRPTSASTIRNNEYANRAVDGHVDDSSRWLCEGGSAGDTLEVDLLDTHLVGSAHLYSGNGSDPVSNPSQNFLLDYWDGNSWLPIPGTAFTSNSNPNLVIPFDTPVRTSKIRYRTTTGNFARVRELLLFPPRAGGYPLGQDVVIGPPPTAAWNDFADSTYRIRVTTPDRRLGLVDGSAIFTNNSAGTDAVNWQLLLNYRDGSYRIRHVKTGQCLALQSISQAGGTRVIAETYTGLPHQSWLLDYTGTTQFRLLNAYSGLALEPLNGNEALGTPLAVGPPNASARQQWDTIMQHHYPKKGIAATTGMPNPPFADPTTSWMGHFFPRYRHSSWSYGWGRQRSDVFPYMGINHVYNPMQWGNFNFVHNSGQGPLESIRNDLQKNARPVSLMGFNEPDGAKQANMSIDLAIRRWPRLEGMEIPLVSPGPVNAPNDWITGFYDQATARGYRIDYTNMHWYKSPSSSALINQLQNVHNTYGRPIWLTEFSAVRWTGTNTWTHADNYNFLAEFLWRAESLPWLARYSLFNFREGVSGPNQDANDPAEAPRSNAIRTDGTLTPFGELYASWDAVTAVLPEKAYHIHNKSRYRRARNPSSSDQITSVTPDAANVANQWYLIPGSTEDTIRIVSTLDGRRLRYYTGTQVGLAAAGNTQSQTEWRIVPVVSGAAHDGWYFIDHPNTGQRLRMDGNGTIQHGGGGNTADDFKWRFVIPMAPDPVAPPAAPSGLNATPSSARIALGWNTAADAATYTLQRSEASGGPWQTLASGLTDPEWSDDELPAETTFHYQVIAVNPLGVSAPSAEVSATTPHPYSTFEGWLLETMGGYSPEDQLPGADPDGDGSENLIEFAFLTDPARSDPGALRMIGAVADTVTFVFPWNWRATGLTWQFRHGSELSDIAAWPVVVPLTVTTTRDGDTDLIRVTIAMIHPERAFYVLELTGK